MPAHTLAERKGRKAKWFTTRNCHRFIIERNIKKKCCFGISLSELLSLHFRLTSADSSSSSDWSPTPMASTTVKDNEGNHHNSFDILMGPAVRTRLPSIHRRLYPSASTSSDD